MRVEIYRDPSGFWRWRVRQASGQIVMLSGMTYASKVNAEAAFRTTLEQLAEADVEDCSIRAAA
jgi:uncharacterized protein YegP (UPF0339 family)